MYDTLKKYGYQLQKIKRLLKEKDIVSKINTTEDKCISKIQ